MNSSKRLIVHVTEALGGGVLYAIAQQANAQVAAGFRVNLIHSVRSDTPGPEALNRIFDVRVSRIYLPMETNPSLFADGRAVRDLVKIFRAEKPAVIHLHSAKAGVLGRAAAFLSNVSRSVFYTPHGYSFLRQDVSDIKRWLFLKAEKISNFFGGHIVACSEFEFELAKDEIRAKSVFLVENAVAAPQINRAARIAGARCIVATLGRITPQKAPERFFSLAEKFDRETGPDFVWIGDGPKDELNKLSSKQLSAVRVTGWLPRDDAMAELARADIFILLSKWEGLPLALVEAQLMGIPCIVADVPGCREIIENGKTGYVCATSEEVLASVERLTSSLDLRLEMGAAAGLRAKERFSMDLMVSKMLEIYFGAPR
jgi:glycosyltransferase involved in cell wall biosynthesis